MHSVLVRASRRGSRRPKHSLVFAVAVGAALMFFPASALGDTTNPPQVTVGPFNQIAQFEGQFNRPDEVPAPNLCPPKQLDPMQLVNCVHLEVFVQATAPIQVNISYDQANLFDLIVYDQTAANAPVAEDVGGNCGPGCTSIAWPGIAGHNYDVAISPFFFGQMCYVPELGASVPCPPPNPPATFVGTVVWNTAAVVAAPVPATQPRRVQGSGDIFTTAAGLDYFNFSEDVRQEDDGRIKGRVRFRNRNNAACRQFQSTRVDSVQFFDSGRRAVIQGRGRRQGSSVEEPFTVETKDGGDPSSTGGLNTVPDYFNVVEPAECSHGTDGHLHKGDVKYRLRGENN
jgi:hypothetical protein